MDIERFMFEYRTDEPCRIVKDGCVGTIRTIPGGGMSKYIMETVRLGGLYDGATKHQAGAVWDKNQLSPTIDTMQGGNREPMIIEEPKCLNSKGGRNGVEGLQPSIQDRVYDSNAISTAVTTSFMPSILEEKTIVAMRGRNPENPSDRTKGAPMVQRLEPNSQGICNTLTSVQKDNLVLESAILTPKRTEYGKSIRKAYESGEIQESRHNMTELEPRTDGISNTLTTVQKDNLLLEKQSLEEPKIIYEEPLDVPGWHRIAKEVLNVNGICTTIPAQSNNLVKKVKVEGVREVERDERFFRQALETLESGECEVGDTVDAFNGKVNKSGVSPTITTRPEGFKTAILPVVENAKIEKVGQISSDGSQYGTVISENGLSSTLAAGTHGYANNCIQSQYRIRKLTPKECWRLMGFSDEDFHKAEQVNSNTQLYKQAGNSICVPVLEAIFKNFF